MASVLEGVTIQLPVEGCVGIIQAKGVGKSVPC